MKILITGVSGFIGQELSKRFIRDGHEVFGMYESEWNFNKNPQIPRLNKLTGNLKSKVDLDTIIQVVNPEIVVHLAAKTEVAHSFDNYAEVSEINYVGTVNLAEACRRFAPDFKLFMMATTMETYGHQPHGTPFTEETVQYPMAPYAVAKKACELYLQYMEYAYKFPFVGFRQTNAYGRHDNDFFVVERIITQMLKGNVVNLGDPKPYRNFLYIDDLVELYVAAINNIEKVKGQFFVTGPDNALSIRELVEKISQLLDWHGVVNWETIPKRPGEIYYLNSNPAKAKKLLGWEPKVSLDDGLKKTIAIWQKNYEQSVATSQERRE